MYSSTLPWELVQNQWWDVICASCLRSSATVNVKKNLKIIIKITWTLISLINFLSYALPYSKVGHELLLICQIITHVIKCKINFSKSPHHKEPWKRVNENSECNKQPYDSPCCIFLYIALGVMICPRELPYKVHRPIKGIFPPLYKRFLWACYLMSTWGDYKGLLEGCSIWCNMLYSCL